MAAIIDGKSKTKILDRDKSEILCRERLNQYTFIDIRTEICIHHAETSVRQIEIQSFHLNFTY